EPDHHDTAVVVVCRVDERAPREQSRQGQGCPDAVELESEPSAVDRDRRGGGGRHRERGAEAAVDVLRDPRGERAGGPGAEGPGRPGPTVTGVVGGAATARSARKPPWPPPATSGATAPRTGPASAAVRCGGAPATTTSTMPARKAETSDASWDSRCASRSLASARSPAAIDANRTWAGHRDSTNAASSPAAAILRTPARSPSSSTTTRSQPCAAAARRAYSHPSTDARTPSPPSASAANTSSSASTEPATNEERRAAGSSG